MTNSHQANILYINCVSTLFGAERALFNTVKILDKTKFRPVVLLPHRGTLENELKSIGIKTIILDYRFRFLRTNPLKLIKLSIDFIKLVKKEKINLIHINLYDYSSNFWIPFLFLKLPVIYHIRGCSWVDIFDRYVMSLVAHKIICVSEDSKKCLFLKRRSDLFIKIRKEIVKMLYDGIDTSYFAPSKNNFRFKEELKINCKTKLIVLVGSLDPNKGQDIFVRAAKIVNDSYDGVAFLIIGESQCFF